MQLHPHRRLHDEDQSIWRNICCFCESAYTYMCMHCAGKMMIYNVKAGDKYFSLNGLIFSAFQIGRATGDLHVIVLVLSVT
jgi:hypothetical protein